MDLGFWGLLWKDGLNKFLLRQTIPDVCVFKGCELQGWYGNNSEGLIVPRKLCDTQAESIDAMYNAFAGPLKFLDAPVAIIRTPCIFADFPPLKGQPAPRIPRAAVLTGEELGKLVQKLLDGEPPRGVSPPDAAERDIWSIQRLIKPLDGVRILSVYSCDVSAIERSDIFGRQFHKVYRVDKKTIIPAVESAVAADRCLTLSKARRAIIETRTLSVVRFMSRFHALDFEGLVLEFIVDADTNPILHGCWASTLFGNEPRQKIPIGAPVPTVGAEVETSASRTDEQNVCEPTELEEASSVAQECSLLLEIWSGEDFLGEAPLRCTVDTQLHNHVLLLRANAEASMRTDERKGRPRSCGIELETITVNLKWVRHGDSPAFLRLGPLFSNQLSPGGQQLPRARVLLWMKATNSDDFSPVWTSQEVLDVENPAWEEVIDLILPPVQEASTGVPPPPSKGVCAVGSASAAIRQRRPESARGRLESQTGTSVVSTGSGQYPARTQSVCTLSEGAELATHLVMCDAGGTMGARGMAHVSQKLGSKAINGINRSALLISLSAQVQQLHTLQLSWDEQWHSSKDTVAKVQEELRRRDSQIERIRAETKDTIQSHQDRMANLCREMCAGIDKHQLQEQEDDTSLVHSQQRLAEQRALLREREERNRAGTKEIIELHQDRMANLCRDLCGGTDRHQMKEHDDDSSLAHRARSQQRLGDQRALVGWFTLIRGLDDQDSAVSSPLDRSHKNFDEVLSNLDAPGIQTGTAAPSLSSIRPESSPSGILGKADEMRREQEVQRAEELRKARARADILTEMSEQDKDELSDLKKQYDMLKADLATETSHAMRLENFVRRIAQGPSAKVRRGGGFILDSTAKREANGILKELATATAMVA